jgi:hypothetical protein
MASGGTWRPTRLSARTWISADLRQDAHRAPPSLDQAVRHRAVRARITALILRPAGHPRDHEADVDPSKAWPSRLCNIIAAIKDAGYLHVSEGQRDHTTPAEPSISTASISQE